MLKTKLADIDFNPPITNAAGPDCDTLELLEKIALSAAGGIVTKTMTIKARQGNPEPRLAKELASGDSLNSMGLPNLGYEEYAKIIPLLKKHNKPIITSISAAGDTAHATAEQYVIMAKAMEQAGADIIEINTSCPNIEKVPVGIDPNTVESILSQVKSAVKTPISVKLMPYGTNLNLFEKIAEIILNNKVECISPINSIPNCMEIDLKTKTKVIKPNRGFGGWGGPSILPVALAEVNRFYNYFKEHGAKVSIFGVGGISSPEAAVKHFLAGANAIQLSTYYMQKGPVAFKEISDGISKWLEKEGYSNINEIVGIVKEL